MFFASESRHGSREAYEAFNNLGRYRLVRYDVFFFFFFSVGDRKGERRMMKKKMLKDLMGVKKKYYLNLDVFKVLGKTRQLTNLLFTRW